MVEQTSREECSWSGVLSTHTKKAEAVANLIDFVAGLVPTA